MTMGAVHLSSLALWKSTRLTHSKSHRDLHVHLGLFAVATAIGVLYWPVTRWTVEKFLQTSLHWHWFVAALSVACAVRANTQRYQPGANTGATILLMLCTVVEVLNQRTLHIQLLSAVLLIVTLHAYTGHLIQSSRWRAMKWPMVVGVALLPLDFYLEPYFGYPLRLFTASVAALVLSGIGLETLSSQSILLVENRANVVDLDCSGINSLWAGGVFYLLLSWLSRLTVNWRWWLLGLLLVALLLSANVVRIVALVVLDIQDLTGLSEIAHTSLGAVGFASSLLVVWKLTDKLETTSSPDQSALTGRDEPTLSWRWPFIPLIAVLLVAAAIPSANGGSAVVTLTPVNLPASLEAKAIDLHSSEVRFFNQSSALAVKYQLGRAELDSSVVLVTSHWWKSQHKPDHCLQAMGFSINNSQVMTMANDGSIHTERTYQRNTTQETELPALPNSINAVTVLNLLDDDQQPYTAVYWFQSAGVITADHYQRMASTFRHPDQIWTLSSLLLQGEADAEQISTTVAPIQHAIAYSYKEKP